MSIYHTEVIDFWLAIAVGGSTLPFYNGDETPDAYAQKSAAFAKVNEYLKRHKDAGRIDLKVDEDGRHVAVCLERMCHHWCDTDKDECKYPNCDYRI
jgi:hypothetical protein